LSVAFDLIKTPEFLTITWLMDPVLVVQSRSQLAQSNVYSTTSEPIKQVERNQAKFLHMSVESAQPVPFKSFINMA
jgi:hypothetical protein